MYQTFCANSNGLTRETIEYYCPAVYAPAAHESRSNSYLYIPTGELLVELKSAGFVPTQVMQARSRNKDHTSYTKHLLRLRHMDELGSRGDVREVVIVNSHNGTSSYQLMQGLFRFICSNGMIVGDYETTTRVQHRGNMLSEVVEGTIRILEEGKETLQEVEQMKQISLSRPEKLLLAKEAMSFRFGDEEEATSIASKIFQPQDFLITRRDEDRQDDLYTVTNVIQENLLSPSRRFVRTDEKNKTHKLRTINGIDQNVKINRAVWRLAQGMMALKQS